MSSDHVQREAAIAAAFIRPERRERFMEVAASRTTPRKAALTPREIKRRSKYVTMLANLEHWLDPECEQLPISGDDPRSEARSRLVALGSATGAYAMSTDPSLDGREMDLEEAFSLLARSHAHGTLVALRDCRAAYYEQSELASLARVLAAGRDG